MISEALLYTLGSRQTFRIGVTSYRFYNGISDRTVDEATFAGLPTSKEPR